MAQLVLNIIDSYHDIMDNKSGKYIYNIIYFLLSIIKFQLLIILLKKKVDLIFFSD